MATMDIHLKAAAFDKVADRLADEVFKRFHSGSLDLAMATVLRQHGWTCTEPTPAEEPKKMGSQIQLAQPAVRRKKARG